MFKAAIFQATGIPIAVRASPPPPPPPPTAFIYPWPLALLPCHAEEKENGPAPGRKEVEEWGWWLQAINILSWACGSITIIFVVLGSNAALIAAAVQAILASAAPGGALYVLLGVTFAGLGPIPTSYYPLPYCFYNGQSYCGTTSIHPISYGAPLTPLSSSLPFLSALSASLPP